MAPHLRKGSRPAETVDGSNKPRAAKKLKKAEHSDSTNTSEEFFTVEDLIHTRATEPGVKDQPILYYPSSGTDYIGYTPRDLLELSNKAATFYASTVPQRTSSDVPPQVVALLGPSNFEYLINLIALSKLGHTLLFLSPRISEEAHVSLLEGCGASHLLVDEGFKHIGERVQKHIPNLQISRIASQRDYSDCLEIDLTLSKLDPAIETKNTAWIIHSSGSTSLPKPNYQSHAKALSNFRFQFDLIGFVTLPLFHMQGLGMVFRAIMNRKHLYMYSGELAPTNKHLVTTLRGHPDIQILFAVPYTIKLLSESREAIELCKKLEVLLCGGAPLPHPIGDKLAKAGVNLVSHFGSSETGQLMNSFRPRSEIEEWDWLRPSAALQPYLRWEPYDAETNIFELVVLDGWPSKSTSNREDGAYATKDLWERHPDFPAKNAWRYYARKDDTINLVNGEKANPLLFEGLARESSMVDEAIVFGSEKPHLGMFVTASEPTLTQEEIVDDIWPAIQKGNHVAPAHGQLSKDMIRLLPAEDAARIRKTDKANIIRAAFYKLFAPLIDAIYEESTASSEALISDERDIRSFLRKEIEPMVLPNRREMARDDTDLFSLGIDSLQASRIRSAIVKNINTGNNKLGGNFVFDFPSINALTNELVRSQHGERSAQLQPVEQRMQTLIDRYSRDFEQHTKSADTPSGDSVLITGATGSLGAHLVAQLSREEDIARVVCLVRQRKGETALERVLQSLRERGVEATESKIRAYSSDLSDPHLGLSSKEVYDEIASQLRCLIHCAWTVNFNLSLESFEQDCIKGTRHLIDLCLGAKSSVPADFVFCSSISTVANFPGPGVPEELPKSLSVAQDMGYAQSKLVAEHICQAATRATGMTTKVLRIGQIVGDTKFGVWNLQEAVPMILQSMTTIGALPKLDEWHSWLPVDTTAAIVAELSRDDASGSGVYNVVNERRFHWTWDFLLMLRSGGLDFDAVSSGEWLQALGENDDPMANPPYKLIESFTKKYADDNQPKRTLYATAKAKAASPCLRNAPVLDQEMAIRLMRFIMKGRISEPPS